MLRKPRAPASRDRSLLPPRQLRVDWHRSTMAHLASVYPLQCDEPFGNRGPYLGTNVTAGFGAFHFDPFELYGAGLLSGPNCLVMGEVGSGKSATVKAFLGRSLAVYGRRRFIAVLDPKGEYRLFASAHGLPVIQLRPGGSERLNPMAEPLSVPDDQGLSRQSLATALVEAVLGRRLDPVEDALLGWSVTSLVRRRGPFTLRDLVRILAESESDAAVLAHLDPAERARSATPVVFALDKLVNRTLAGMFDGDSTVPAEWADGPGVVVDLSAVYDDREALPLVMLAATAWLTAARRNQDDRRTIQVIDEAWAAVADGARFFQSSLKLARAIGVSTWLVCHRPSDLTAQSDDGTSEAKIAAGLLSDIQTRIVLRQPPDQVPLARDLLGLGEREADAVGRLVKGRALWRLQTHSAIAQLVLTARERRLYGTDGAMDAI